MSDEQCFGVRGRAYEFADSGRYRRWDQVADALQHEGFLPATITRLDEDRQAVLMITHCCARARA